MKIFLVIPAFNEHGRLEKVLAKAKKHIPSQNIVVVDDGSSTPVRLPGITVLRHVVNLGKGAAMTTGAVYAFRRRAGAIIFMDADGQHNPDDLPRFVNLLNRGYDVVFGSRRLPADTPFIRLMGNKIATFYINVIFRIKLSDILSGFRGLTSKAYSLLRWESPRYGAETEMVARLGKFRSRLTFTELHIETIYIDKYKGVTIIDAINILANSLWWKLF